MNLFLRGQMCFALPCLCRTESVYIRVAATNLSSLFGSFFNYSSRFLRAASVSSVLCARLKRSSFLSNTPVKSQTVNHNLFFYHAGQ